MFIKREGIQLYVKAAGVGKPALIFVHGWLSNADIWKYQIAEFSKTYKVIALDLRGFGRSDKPQVEYTFDLFAEDLDFVINELNLDDVVLIGWSKGASIGLVYAASHGERLSKLVLVDGGPKLISSDGYEYGLPLSEIKQVIDLMGTDYKTVVKGFISAELPETTSDKLKKWLFNIAMQTPKEVAINSIINDSKYDLRDSLEKIKLPTLVCYGELDSICPPGGSIFLNTNIAISEIFEFKGLGHIPFLTNPEGFNSCLRSFISRE